MIRFKLTRIDPQNLSKQLQELPKRLEDVRYSMGSSIAYHLQKKVRYGLPSSSGWLGVYKNAINFYFNGKEWVVGAIAEVAVENLEATKTLIYFSGGTDHSKVLGDYNPWVVHMIPATNKPYKASMRAQFVSESEVKKREQELVQLMPKIKQALTAAGASIDPYGIPTVNGKATADLRHLANQLEYGYAPFIGRGISHWRPAVNKISEQLRESTQFIRSRFESILKGEVTPKAPPTPGRLQAMFAASRRVFLPKLE